MFEACQIPVPLIRLTLLPEDCVMEDYRSDEKERASSKARGVLLADGKSLISQGMKDDATVALDIDGAGVHVFAYLHTKPNAVMITLDAKESAAKVSRFRRLFPSYAGLTCSIPRECRFALRLPLPSV